MDCRKVIVFGVFDPVRSKMSESSADAPMAHRASNGVDELHEGHRRFLADAKKHGSELIVAVARDEVVRELKNKTPRHNEEERRAAVARLTAVTRAVLGDREQGTYEVIKKFKPDVICLGYDQDGLAEDLEKRMADGEIPRIPLVRLKPHEGERLHTALLTKSSIPASIGVGGSPLNEEE